MVIVQRRLDVKVGEHRRLNVLEPPPYPHQGLSEGLQAEGVIGKVPRSHIYKRHIDEAWDIWFTFPKNFRS